MFTLTRGENIFNSGEEIADAGEKGGKVVVWFVLIVQFNSMGLESSMGLFVCHKLKERKQVNAERK